MARQPRKPVGRHPQEPGNLGFLPLSAVKTAQEIGAELMAAGYDTVEKARQLLKQTKASGAMEADLATTEVSRRTERLRSLRGAFADLGISSQDVLRLKADDLDAEDEAR